MRPFGGPINESHKIDKAVSSALGLYVTAVTALRPSSSENGIPGLDSRDGG
jgi:hypothetical protein